MENEIAELRAQIEAQRDEIAIVKSTMLAIVDTLGSLIETIGLPRDQLSTVIAAQQAQLRSKLDPNDPTAALRISLMESAAERLRLPPTEAQVIVMQTDNGGTLQ